MIPTTPQHDELIEALRLETGLVHELCATLLRQRTAVAASDTEAIDRSVDATGRILFTLGEVRRVRRQMVETLTGGALDRLDAMPGCDPRLLAARTDLACAAREVHREASINRVVLQRATEAGEQFLHRLFGGTPSASAPPGYAEPGASAAGLIVDRIV